MPPMTGRVIAGRYNLQHPIGRGAMGVVWRARDQLLDRDVAVKEVTISALIGPEERRNAYQRTLREARTAARLSHRGVVAVYDVAEEDGRPWIVMELVPSQSLDQVLTVQGRLQPPRVGRIGQQLLAALAAAHAAGVLHRDVKPSNVLIATDRTPGGWDERAVLTDFGIAQFEGDPRLTQTGMVMGSPGFTAPERIRGSDATSASDLWSLGATLYAAVEGRGPYESRGGPITTMTAIINEDAPGAPHAGRLSPLIAALLRREPASRPSAATAAQMFAQVLPRLGEAVKEPPAVPHAPTVRSAYVPSSIELVTPASVTARQKPAPEPVVRQVQESAPAPEPPPVPGEALASVTDEPAASDSGPVAVADEAAGSAATAKAAVLVAAGTPSAEPADGGELPAAEAAAAEPGLAPAAPTESLSVQPTPAEKASADQEQPGPADSPGYQPTQIAIPVARAGTGAPPRPAQPKPPGPTFTAASPADRIAARPTTSRPVAPSSGSRPPYASYQPHRPPQGSPPGPYAGASLPPAGSATALPPAGAGYAGPSQASPDLARQYQPGAGGGRAGRRRGPGRLILLVASAVVLAIAIGVGAAFAFGHKLHPANATTVGNTGSGSSTGVVTSAFKSVNAVNDPTAVPASWTTKTYPATDFQSDVKAGFSVGLPPRWTSTVSRDHVELYGPDGVLLEIDLAAATHPGDMIAHAQYVEQQAVGEGRLPDYKRVNIKPVTVLGTKGAIWQFSWRLKGVTEFTDDIFFVKPTPAGSQSYALYLRAPKASWGSKYLPMFDSILHTFRTVPAS